MAKISESSYGMSASYTIKFWYTNEEGYTRQTTETVYTNSKGAHKLVERYAVKNFSKLYKDFSIISIVCD